MASSIICSSHLIHQHSKPKAEIHSILLSQPSKPEFQQQDDVLEDPDLEPFRQSLRNRENLCRQSGRLITAYEIQEIEFYHLDSVGNRYAYSEQTSTVNRHYNEFCEWKHWADILYGGEDSEEFVVSLFIRGLKEEIRNHLPFPLPSTMLAAFISAVSVEIAWNITEGLKEAFDKFTPRKPVENQESTHDEEVTKLADTNSKSKERHLSQGDLVVEGSEAEQGFESPDSRMATVNEGIDRVSSLEVFKRPLWSFKTTSHELEKVFDDLTERNLVETKEASDEPDLCTFETDDSCKLFGKQVVVAAPMIMAEPCTLTIKVNCHPFIDAFPLTECMVDSVGTKVLIFYSMMVAYEPNDRMISLQDVSSDYENLIKELPFNSHAKRTVENEFHILQLTDNRASFILSPCCVYDPGGLWKFVCDASWSLDLLHDKFCSRAVGVHQIRTWFNEIWVLNTLDDCFDGVFGVGIRDGFVGDTHVTIQTPRTREHGKFQSGSTYYFDEIQYSIIKFLVLDGLAATIISWVFGRLAWVIVLMASRLGNISKRVNTAAFIELSTLHDAYVCILFAPWELLRLETKVFVERDRMILNIHELEINIHQTKKVQVGIVGGESSGLSASYALVNLGYNNVSLFDNYNLGGHVLVANEMECELEEMDSHTFGTIDTSTGQYEDMKFVDDYLSVISLTLKLQDEAKDTGLLGVHAMCTIAAEPTPEFLKHYGCKIVLNSLAYGFTASEILNMEQTYMTSRIPIHLAYVEHWDEQLRGIAPRRAGYLLTNTITSVLRYEATEKASQLTFVVQIQRTTMIKSQIRIFFHKWKEKQLHLEGKVAFRGGDNVTEAIARPKEDGLELSKAELLGVFRRMTRHRFSGLLKESACISRRSKLVKK